MIESGHSSLVGEYGEFYYRFEGNLPISSYGVALGHSDVVTVYTVKCTWLPPRYWAATQHVVKLRLSLLISTHFVNCNWLRNVRDHEGWYCPLWWPAPGLLMTGNTNKPSHRPLLNRRRSWMNSRVFISSKVKTRERLKVEISTFISNAHIILYLIYVSLEWKYRHYY